MLLSAKADGQGWIFDWRLTLAAVVAANIAQFLMFTRISTVIPGRGPSAID
ncbi:MAG: hypothetical protein H0W08_19025 [Acidobacteria bacterium]|nr:hypothetical protein [Acidobacteriota bacterium]